MLKNWKPWYSDTLVAAFLLSYFTTEDLALLLFCSLSVEVAVAS